MKALKRQHLSPRFSGKGLFLGFLCLGSGYFHATAAENDNNAAYWRELASQRITAEKERAAAESDWSLQKALLEQRIALLKSEAQTLDADMAKLKENEAKASQERKAFEETLATLKSETDAARKLLARAENALAERYTLLPPYLQKKIYPALNGLDAAAADKKPFAERVQNLVSALNEIEKSRMKIAVQREAIQPSGNENPLQMRIAYLGIDFAYATDESDSVAYMGYAKGGQWHWQAIPEQKDTVSRLFNIFDNREQAIWLDIPLSREVQP